MTYAGSTSNLPKPVAAKSIFGFPRLKTPEPSKPQIDVHCQHLFVTDSAPNNIFFSCYRFNKTGGEKVKFLVFKKNNKT